MRVWRAILSSRRGRAVALVVAAYVGWQGWLTLRAPGKIAPDLPGVAGAPVDVVVTLRFAPERFHVLVFQQFGRVSGTRGNQVELRAVSLSDLRAIARPYWVTRVEPISR